VIIKYKNKTYSSEDLPIFLYFKCPKDKKDFINLLTIYHKPNIFVKINSVDFILAGNTIIKDKRSAIYINMETIDEKRHIQRYLFNSNDESNAVISTPPDIRPVILEEWISRHAKNLILS